jgi:quercetin dioxygenase-like cupin family protein
MFRRCLLALCFVAFGAALDRLVLAQPNGITRTVLLTTDDPGGKTHEAVVAVAELQPGAVSGRHRHPGIEIGYVLEGSARLEHEGHPVKELKPGDAFKNDGVHNVTNTSGARAKILAVYLVEKGKPLAEPVSGPAR